MTHDNPSLLKRPKEGWEAYLDQALAPLFTAVLTDPVRKALSLYLDLVNSWGGRVDLTAARNVEELVDLSVADAAVMAEVELGAGLGTDHIMDVGTGGGAPGIPLLVLLAGTRGFALPSTLVEPRTKRTAFLRTACAEIGLSGTRVARSRSDVLVHGTCDVALARATLPPPSWLLEGARLSRSAVWVLLAKEEAPTLSGLRISHDIRYQWPLTGASRRAVRFVKE